MSRLCRGRQTQHADQNRKSWKLSHSMAIGMRVPLEHADSNPSLVSVNHGDIPYGQTGPTSGGAWTNLGDPVQGERGHPEPFLSTQNPCLHCQQKRQQQCTYGAGLGRGSVSLCSQQKWANFSRKRCLRRPIPTLASKYLTFNNFRLDLPPVIHSFFEEARDENRPSPQPHDPV